MTACESVVALSNSPTVISTMNSFANTNCSKEKRLTILGDVRLLEGQLYLLQLLWVYNDASIVRCDDGYINVDIGLTFAQTFCGEKKLFPIYSTHKNITISFNNAVTSASNDITIRASMIKAENYEKGLQHGDCSETYLSNRSGIITSPNYPFGYLPGSCLYKIKVGKNKQINLHVMDFMLIPSGYLCSKLDDNIRIRAADSFQSNFEYMSDIDEEYPYFCDSMADHPKIYLKDVEYLFIQFNTNKPTVIHRGFSFGYTVEDYMTTSTIDKSSIMNIIIGTVVSVSAVITGSLIITFLLSKKKRRKIDTVSAENKNSVCISTEEKDENSSDKLSRVSNTDKNPENEDSASDNEELFASNLKRLRELYSMNNNASS